MPPPVMGVEYRSFQVSMHSGALFHSSVVLYATVGRGDQTVADAVSDRAERYGSLSCKLPTDDHRSLV